MILSYTRPPQILWSLVGTGAEFLTDPVRLTNGRPNSSTRIQWLSGAQTTSSVLTLRCNVTADEQSIRMAGLIGTTLPVGTKVVCKRLLSLSWTGSQQQRVIERSDGVRVVWFYFDPLVYPYRGFEFEIYNDVDGVASILADSTFEIGEAWGAQASEWNIRPSYQSDREQLSKYKASLGGQPFRVARRSVNISQLEFTPLDYTDVFDAIQYTPDGAISGAPIDYVRSQILGYAPCVVVPMTARPFTGASTDMDYINRHAEFGFAKTVGPIIGDAPRFVFSATFEAPPALLP